MATSFIVAMGLLRIGLFDLMPIARSKVINQMGDSFVLLDEQGRISDYNPSFGKLFNRPEEELLARPLNDLFGQNVVSHLSGSSNLVRYKDQHFELSRVAINHGSKVVGQSIVFKNVTERVIGDRRLQEQRLELEELNGLKDRLFSVIAHDLRGPLHNLQEVLSLVNANVLNDEERSMLMVQLSSSVDQSVSLMENLLSWASSQQRGENIKRETFPLDTLLSEVLNSIKALVEKKSLKVEINVAPNLVVFADREMIKIVLRNLLGNAIKFSQKDTTITVNTRLKKAVEIEISDQGVGMSDEVLGKLFSVGLSSRRGTSNEEGSGLGLMLCKDFIEKNGGLLKIRSKEGEGSTFSFSLPQE